MCCSRTSSNKKTARPVSKIRYPSSRRLVTDTSYQHLYQQILEAVSDFTKATWACLQERFEKLPLVVQVEGKMCRIRVGWLFLSWPAPPRGCYFLTESLYDRMSWVQYSGPKSTGSLTVSTRLTFISEAFEISRLARLIYLPC